MKGSERVGERSCSSGGKEAVLQQESVEIHDDPKGDVRIARLSTLSFPLRSAEFIVTVVVMDFTVAREDLSETSQWTGDREVTGETLEGGLQEGRSGTSLTTVGRPFSGLKPTSSLEVLCQPYFSTSSWLTSTERVVPDLLSAGGFHSEHLPVNDACHRGRRSFVLG